MLQIITGKIVLAVNLLQAAVPVSTTSLLLILVIVLLLFTAIISGAETAFFSLSAKDIEYLKTRDKPNTRKVFGLLEQPKMLLANILVANMFINISIITASSFLLGQLLTIAVPQTLLIVIKILIIAFLLVLFGGVLPKVYATQNNMRMVLFAAPVLKLTGGIFSPISRMLVSSSNYIDERLNSNKSDANLSNKDFEQAIELTMGHTATQEEINIFKAIVKFSNITVRQIMRTRLDVSGIPYDYTFQQVQQFAVKVGYSRIPVYKNSLDTIVGIVNSKDFLLHSEDLNFDWHSLIRPAYYVHENKFIEDLLKEFQQSRTHFAVVVDEFGGTSGIVTLEDIMEEIIGDIKDEFDEDDLQYKKIDENTFVFEGKTLINDVCRIMGEPVETFGSIRGESDSLAGLILEIAGKFPSLNETISYENFDFLILEIEKMRIKRVKVLIDRVEKD